jgi:hypothetical protein
MRKLLGALSVFLVICVIVLYARDCRLSFSQWRLCGESKGQPGVVGETVNFNWNKGGLLSDVLYVDGKPAARLVKYSFSLEGDSMEVASLDGTKQSRYCGK